MIPSLQPSDFSQLSIAERIILVEQIWDSIAAEQAAVPLTPAQEAELDRRLEAHRKSPQEAPLGKRLRPAFRRNDDTRPQTSRNAAVGFDRSRSGSHRDGSGRVRRRSPRRGRLYLGLQGGGPGKCRGCRQARRLRSGETSVDENPSRTDGDRLVKGGCHGKRGVGTAARRKRNRRLKLGCKRGPPLVDSVALGARCLLCCVAVHSRHSVAWFRSSRAFSSLGLPWACLSWHFVGVDGSNRFAQGGPFLPDAQSRFRRPPHLLRQPAPPPASPALASACRSRRRRERPSDSDQQQAPEPGRRRMKDEG